jgi:hypothetical protein
MSRAEQREEEKRRDENQARLQKNQKWDSLDHKAVTTKVKKHDLQWAHFSVRNLGRKQASTLWSSSVATWLTWARATQ